MEPVTTRIISKSISCCKRFPFKNSLTALGSVEHWLNELATEVTDRLEQELVENNRRAKQITVSFAQEIDGTTISSSKTFPLSCYKQEKIFRDVFDIVKKHLTIKPDGSLIVNFLGLCAGTFTEIKKGNIVDLFKNVGQKVKKETGEIAENDSGSIISENILYSSVENKSSPIDIDDYNQFLDSEHTGNEFPNLSSHIEDMKNCSTSSEPNTQNSKSFFLNYFASKKSEQQNKYEDLNESSAEQSNSLIQPDLSEDTQKCPECGKNIVISEVVSHKDYHFALKLEKEETQNVNLDNDSPKPSQIKSKKLSPTVIKSGYKLVRKKFDHQPITSFLGKVEDLNDSNSDVCTECRKRVRFEEFENHSDYHAAKRLHSELNNDLKNHTSLIGSKTVKSDLRTRKDILSFFKKK